MINRKPFLWGVSTSCYQIEGAHDADGKGPNIWDKFCQIPGKVVDGTNGNKACDHYNLYKDDVKLIKDLGVDVYRFSLSWSRMLPKGTGEVNGTGVDFYNRLVDELLENDIEPWITLYHWDLPLALQEKGGWTSRDIVSYFADYADFVAQRLGDRVNNFIILNEPSVHAFEGHLIGTHAPGLTGEANFFKAVHHQNMVIGQTYDLLKSRNSKFHVGSSYTTFPVRTEGKTDEDIVARDVFDAAWNGVFFDALFKGKYPDILRERIAPYVEPSDMSVVKRNLDFIGLQHYSPTYVKPTSDNDLGTTGTEPPVRFKRTDMGWPIEPEGFYECLKSFQDEYLPKSIVITENGAAMPDKMVDGSVKDFDRIEYFESYLAQVERAIEDGVKVDGYFAWSFMDNFEWAFGLAKRFGIVHVDYDTLKRTPKASYQWWQERLEEERDEIAA